MPENEEQPTPRDWTGLRWRDHPVGHFVFIVACVTALALVLLVNWISYPPFPDPVTTDYRAFRSAEILLTIAGLGLIASFLNTTVNAVALLVGFLVVAALIIPPKDLIRLFLVATDSEKKLGSYYSTSTAGNNTLSDIRDVAPLAAYSIEGILMESDGRGLENRLDELTRQQIIDELENVLTLDRYEGVLQRLQSRGALELLAAIERGETREFLFQHSANDRLERDIALLHYESLISITYDDPSTAILTDHGREVAALVRSGGVQRDVISNRLRLPDSLVEIRRLRGFGCNELEIDSTGTVFDLNPEETTSQSYRAPTNLILNVETEISGDYLLKYEALDGSFDPTMSLFKLSEAGATFSCTLVEYNDDGVAGTLNSEIIARLEAGRYFVRLSSFEESYSGGEGVFSVTPREPVEAVSIE